MESEPMRITNFFVDSPCTVICSFYLILVICLFVTVAFSYMIPSLGGGRSRDFAIVSSPIQIDNDIFNLAEEEMMATRGDKV
jgi:hypothetical protein